MALTPISRTILAARQLGLKRLGLNALYRIAGYSGFWKILTPVFQKMPLPAAQMNQQIGFPSLPEQFLNRKLTASEKKEAIREADEIVAGKIRLFGGEPVPLNLDPETGRRHWSHFDKSQFSGKDIKFTWEPARFAWAVCLARAYLITKNEAYPEAFWRYFESFTQHNPPNCGPNWASAQEVAVRIMLFTYAYQVFKESDYSTTTRKHNLARAIALHAQRIPPTNLYAVSQSNNHLLVEAAGLYTAAVFLPDHPQSGRWKELGWKWFNQGILEQVEPDGTYTQHSANYHRLMLQTALWVYSLGSICNQSLPADVLSRLASATTWLFAILDSNSGQVPNLGNNDGAYLFPFTGLDYRDYRPVLQAASIAFLGKPFFSTELFDEMAHWFGLSNKSDRKDETLNHQNTGCLKVGTSLCWATLRAADFKLRPAHADQLHVDLWANGYNILLDPGTYLYNADPPWDNPLSQTRVHNTLEINGQNQMLRAGRFLWLKLAQAKILLIKPDEVMAEHDGYRHSGWYHRRSLKYASPDTFIITDRLIPVSPKIKPTRISLQWLFPDWPGNLSNTALDMRSPFGKINFSSFPQTINPAPILDDVQLVRCGENLSGTTPALPYQGWYSPTYASKSPALSLRLFFTISGDTTITSKLFIHQTLTQS